jgi:BirA family transcriptional regulator, biotin operon repressor / biotin---[acetyl-CoA-carboxylase] ligase
MPDAAAAPDAPTPDRRALVLRALKAAPSGVSGEALARELGVSRAAVGKHVSALRDLGYAIDATAGAGYRLTASPDAPLPLEVAPLLRASLWNDLRGGRVTGSTNDDVRAAAAAGAPEGLVALATEQRAGRGRLGRDWVSAPGGVYASVLLRPTLTPAELSPLALVVGLGLARGLESLGARVALKWPNDILDAAGGGKLVGILLEGMTEGERMAWIVAGFGVNVRRSALPGVAESIAAAPEPASAPAPAYLDDLTTTPVPLAEVAAVLLDGLAAAYARFLAEGFARGLKDDYESRLALVGEPVRVSDPYGGPVAEGTCEGVDEWGRLVVRGEGEAVHVPAGDVTLRR